VAHLGRTGGTLGVTCGGSLGEVLYYTGTVLYCTFLGCSKNLFFCFKLTILQKGTVFRFFKHMNNNLQILKMQEIFYNLVSGG